MLYLIISCEDKDEQFADMPDLNIIDVSQESDWEYCVIGKDDYYFIEANDFIPEVVLFHSTDDNIDYSITFNENGLPNRIVVDSFIFIFENHNGNNVDIGIIYPDGTNEIIREVTTQLNWDDISLLLRSSAAWSDVIRWTGRLVQGVPCALSIAATVSTSGIAWPLAAWACGNYLLTLSADVIEDDFNVHNGFTEFVDMYGMAQTGVTCHTAQAISCATSLAGLALDDWADYQEELESNSDDVQLLEGALQTNYGDIQITLTWDTSADLDLWVTDPYGNKIYFANPFSESGGWLDVDDTNGYGPENVFWPENGAPSGNYLVQVDHWAGASPSNYSVLVQANDQVAVYSGTINAEETHDILTFNSGGNLPRIIIPVVSFGLNEIQTK